MRTSLDFFKKPLDHIVGVDGLPMLRQEGVEDQASLQIALQAGDGSGIGLLIFFHEQRDGEKVER